MVYGVALLSERHVLPPRRASTTSDLLSVLDEWHSVPAHVQRVARENLTKSRLRRMDPEWVQHWASR